MSTNNTTDYLIAEIEYSQYLKYGIVVVALLIFLCIIGIIGNAHVFIVYMRFNDGSNFNTLILALAANDFLACCFNIPFEIIHVRYKYTFQGSELCKSFRFSNYIFVTSSGLFLALVAVERVRKICTPFHMQWSIKTIYIACVSVFVFSVICSIPSLIFYDIVPKAIPGYMSSNGTICGSNNKKITSFHFILLLFISTMAFLVVFVSYSLITVKFFRHRETFRKESISLSEFETDQTETESKSSKKFEEKESKSNGSEKDILHPVIKNKTESTSFQVSNTQASLRRNGQRNHKYDKTINKAMRNTITLMVASLVSYVGLFPMIIRGIIRLADEDIYQEINHFMGPVAKNIIIRSYFLNNVVNPFVYCFMDKKFRNGSVKFYKDIASLFR